VRIEPIIPVVHREPFDDPGWLRKLWFLRTVFRSQIYQKTPMFGNRSLKTAVMTGYVSRCSVTVRSRPR
jgi:hypothetical protein